MRKIFVAMTMAAVLMMGSVAGASPGGTTQIPDGMRVTAASNVDGSVYRVFFVENIYSNQYRYFAGPWFTLEGAQRAAERLDALDSVPANGVRIQVLAPGQDSWQNFAE